MRYFKKFFSSALMIVFGFSLSTYAQSTPSSKVDSTFEKYMDKAWDDIRKSNMSDSVQHVYSKKFYKYYQLNPKTSTGKDALSQAFMMWGNTGNAKYLNDALQSLDYNSEIWGKIINSLGNIYYRNDDLDTETYNELLVELKEKLTDPDSKSAIILSLLRKQKAENNKKEAIELAQQLVELDASEFYVDQGLSNLYEFESLNVGQPAPNFSTKTIEGKTISLSKLNGQYVLLDFWATWCGPCLPEIPHLKTLWNKHKDSNFEIVGISLDREKSALTQFVNEKDIEWPQILETNGWDGKITEMYNVVGIPRTYLIGPDGMIVAKDLRGEEMMGEVEKYLNR